MSEYKIKKYSEHLLTIEGLIKSIELDEDNDLDEILGRLSVCKKLLKYKIDNLIQPGMNVKRLQEHNEGKCHFE